MMANSIKLGSFSFWFWNILVKNLYKINPGRFYLAKMGPNIVGSDAEQKISKKPSLLCKSLLNYVIRTWNSTFLKKFWYSLLFHLKFRQEKLTNKNFNFSDWRTLIRRGWRHETISWFWPRILLRKAAGFAWICISIAGWKENTYCALRALGCSSSFAMISYSLLFFCNFAISSSIQFSHPSIL